MVGGIGNFKDDEGGIYSSAKYVIYVLISSFDIYRDNGKLLAKFNFNKKTLLPNEYERT